MIDIEGFLLCLHKDALSLPHFLPFGLRQWLEVRVVFRMVEQQTCACMVGKISSTLRLAAKWILFPEAAATIPPIWQIDALRHLQRAGPRLLELL